MKIIFMGTPDFAVATLRALIENHYNVVAVVTQPDKPVGRHGSVLQPSAVKQYALEQGIPVLQPKKMKDPVFLEQLRSYQADLQVVVAFRMLPEVVWAMPRFGTFNVHAALLPQYRGAAPINWAVINGETQTGVTTFFLDHNIDTGRIILQRPFPIPDDADVEYVYDGLMNLGAQICLDTIRKIEEGNGTVETLPQEEMIPVGTTLHAAPKIFKDTCRINWQQSAKRIYDFIRGLSPYPGTWTHLLIDSSNNETSQSVNQPPQVLKIYQSAKTRRPATGTPGTLVMEKGHLFVNTTDTLLEILQLQPAGKRRMAAADFLNGMQHQQGLSLE